MTIHRWYNDSPQFFECFKLQSNINYAHKESVGLYAKLLFKAFPPFKLHAKNPTEMRKKWIVLWLGKKWHWQGRQLPFYIRRVQLKNHRPLFTGLYVIYGAFGHGWCKQGYFGSRKQRVGPTTLTQHFNIKSRSNLLIDLDRNFSSPNLDKWTLLLSFKVRILDNRFLAPCIPAWLSLLIIKEGTFDSLTVRHSR